MGFHRLGVLAAASLALLLLVAPIARAVPVTGGGIDQALGCSSVACGSTQTLVIGTDVAAASGTLDLDSSALTLSFQLSVAALPLVPLGPDDNGVTQVSFLDTVYQAVGLTLLGFGDTFVVGPNQTASISGTQSQSGMGAPAAGAFAAPTARVTGTCHTAGGGLACGLAFGQTSFSFDVGSPSAARYFQHTANIVASPVPEPTTCALMSLGLLGIATAGRRRAA